MTSARPKLFIVSHIRGGPHASSRVGVPGTLTCSAKTLRNGTPPTLTLATSVSAETKRLTQNVHRECPSRPRIVEDGGGPEHSFQVFRAKNPSGRCLRASLDQRQRLQKVLFPSGLPFSTDKGFGTAQSRSIFNTFRDV